jgi:hypothetical protein
MPRWRVDIMGKVLATLGSVEAPDEESAIAAPKEFHITPARRNKIAVARIEEAPRQATSSTYKQASAWALPSSTSEATTSSAATDPHGP